VKNGNFPGSSSPQAGQRIRPTCQANAQRAQWSMRIAPSPVPGPGGMRRDEIHAPLPQNTQVPDTPRPGACPISLSIRAYGWSAARAR